MALTPDGEWVLSGSKDRGVQFWDPRTGDTQLMLQGHKNSGNQDPFPSSIQRGGKRNGLLIIASAPQSFQSLLARRGSFLPREVAICVRASGGQRNSQDLFDDAFILTLTRQSDMGRINEDVINAIGCVSKSTRHLLS